MPHEKIISGDIEGDGVEGHRKKITGGEFPRKTKEDQDFGQGDKPDEKRHSGPERSKINDSGDLFYTGFGSAKAKDAGTPKKKSVIGGDSDIFDTGFGSATRQKKEKIVHITGSPGRVAADNLRAERNAEKSVGRSAERKSFFSEDEVDELFEAGEPEISRPEPEKRTETKKGSKMTEDPFYTGFGYTDQRGKGSPADGGLFPEGDTLPAMPERELVPDRGERDVYEEAGPELEVYEEKPKPAEKSKRSSVLTRDDDDLFS